MKSFLKILSLFLILIIPHEGQAQWVRLTDPSNSDVVGGLVAIDTTLFAWAAGGSGGAPGTIGSSTIFLSNDQGINWTMVDSGLPYMPISFVADGANLFAGTSDSGLYNSTNNGASWHLATGSSELQGNVGWLYESGGKLLAGIYDTGNFLIFLSNDSGKSWISVGSPSPDILPIAAIGTNLFVGTLRNGVFRSTDSGISWVAINNGFPFDSTENIYMSCNTIVLIGTTIFAGTQNGIFLTTDNGINWTPANTGLPTNTSVNSFAESGANIFAGTDKGIFLSTNNGTNWIAVNEGLTVTSMNGLLVYDTTLFATTGNLLGVPGGVWRRPLSEMISTSAVSEAEISVSQIQSYPNPFSQSTTINFTTPENGAAEVSVVNILGTTVAKIFSGELQAGEHSFMWNKPTGLPDGMYECIIQMNGSVERVPMVLTQ